MKNLFDEYGLFILAIIVGFACISMFLLLFIGPETPIGVILDTIVERLI